MLGLIGCVETKQRTPRICQTGVQVGRLELVNQFGSYQHVDVFKQD